MKKTTFVFALLWLTFYSIQAQIFNENLTSKQKAENYINSKGEVCFTFQANNEEQFKEIARFLSIGHKHIDRN